LNLFLVMSKQRKKQSRKLKPSIYIVCEGTNTERIYFEEIAQQPDVFEKYAITVYPSEEDQIKAAKKLGESIKTDALNLVKLAKQEIKNYNEVWAVFDKDGYTKHEQAFLEAEKHGVNLAFSSIAFEHWILLHYEQHQIAFSKSQNVIDYLEQAGYFTNYSKKADISIYSKLKNLTEIAIQNSAWLRMEMAQSLANCNNKIYELNPYTTADKLVAKLLDFNSVVYGAIKETLKIGNISITVNAVQHNIQIITLSVHLVNHRNISYLVNHKSDCFYLTDECQNRFELAIDRPMIIEPSLSQDFVLKFEILKFKIFFATGTLRLHFSPDRKEILIIALV
jgi:RloB-like protein